LGEALVSAEAEAVAGQVTYSLDLSADRASPLGLPASENVLVTLPAAMSKTAYVENRYLFRSGLCNIECSGLVVCDHCCR
jgi:hypothetical protein